MIAGGLVVAGAAFAADDHGTADEAVAMVKRTVAAYQANGKDSTFAAITGKDPLFHDRDLYVIVWDMNGNNLAHGANAKMVGRNMAEVTDVDGKPYARERLTLAATQSSFWSDYKFTNPVTKKIEPKTTYCEVTDSVIFCVGIYKE